MDAISRRCRLLTVAVVLTVTGLAGVVAQAAVGPAVRTVPVATGRFTMPIPGQGCGVCWEQPG